MATALTAKRATTALGKTSHLFRSSFTFLRGLSTTTSSTENAAAAAEGDGAKKPRRKKKKNLFEVAQFLPNWGIGYHMAKTHWAEVSYEITKINLYKVRFFFSSHFALFHQFLLCLLKLYRFLKQVYKELLFINEFCRMEGTEKLGDLLIKMVIFLHHYMICLCFTYVLMMVHI